MINTSPHFPDLNRLCKRDESRDEVRLKLFLGTYVQ